MHSRKAHTGPRVSPLSVPNCKDDATRFERRKDCFCCRTPGAVANDNYGGGAPPMTSVDRTTRFAGGSPPVAPRSGDGGLSSDALTVGAGGLAALSW
jgi:hypothetical protein